MSRRDQHERGGERGFALLLVFVMAAAVALMLYRQMPRVAFESERGKEQLLIDRGSQYQRAIQVYFYTYKRFPSTIEDLENTNDHRYLRRRYIDPYTGKNEWRLVHTNGVTLTDSKVQAPPNPANANGNGNGNGSNSGAASAQAASSTAPANGNTPAPPAAVNAAVAARPSDRTLPDNQSYSNPTPAGGYNPVQNNPVAQNNPPNYNDPIAFPPISLYPNGYNAAQPGQPGNGLQTAPNQTGLNQPGLNQPGLNQPGLNQGGFSPNQPGLNQPGLNQPGLNQAGSNPTGFYPIQPGTIPPGLPAGITTPSLPPGMTVPGAPPGLPPGVQSPVGAPGTVPTFPGATSLDGSQQVTGQQFPGQQFPGQQFPGQQSFAPQQPSQQFPVQQAPVQQLPGQQPQSQGQFNPANPGAAGATNPGLSIINQLLTTPRPAPQGIGPGTNNQTIGGGIAGVASKFAGPTIKSYGGRTDYSEWEFIYQLPQQAGIPQNGQALGGQPYTGPNTNVPGPPPAGAPPPPPGGAPPPPPGGFPSIPSFPH